MTELLIPFCNIRSLYLETPPTGKIHFLLKNDYITSLLNEASIDLYNNHFLNGLFLSEEIFHKNVSNIIRNKKISVLYLDEVIKYNAYCVIDDLRENVYKIYATGVRDKDIPKIKLLLEY